MATEKAFLVKYGEIALKGKNRRIFEDVLVRKVKDALAKTQLGAWEYDIVGTYYKCNMTDIMASIGLAQIKRYSKMLEKRIQDKATGVFISDPNVEIVTLYTRMALKVSISDIYLKLLGKYHIDKSILVEIDYLKKRIVWERVEQMVSEYYNRYASQVIGIMRKNIFNSQDVFALRRIAEKVFRKDSRNMRHGRSPPI